MGVRIAFDDVNLAPDEEEVRSSRRGEWVSIRKGILRLSQPHLPPYSWILPVRLEDF